MTLGLTQEGMFKNMGEWQYLNLLETIMTHGRDRGDRTGTGTRGIFGAQLNFDLQQGFPLLTTKKVFFYGIIEELLWFLRGETHVKSLQEKGVKIWDAWATKEQCAKFGRKEGDLGPVYGHQWRNFGATSDLVEGEQDGHPAGPVMRRKYRNDGVDQIKWVLEEIKNNPNSRRLIVSGWNPNEQSKVALPPCHTMFQFYVQEGKLDCQLYQRSGDMFLGVPFNIASYALLTHLVARHCGLTPGRFVHTFGDAHIYRNHFDQVKEQLSRDIKSAPVLHLMGSADIFQAKSEDIAISSYNPHPPIKAEVSI